MKPLPTTREQARIEKSNRYDTGQPCKHGHFAPRATSSGSCCECIKIARNAWTKKQPKKRLAEYTRQYRKRRDSGVTERPDPTVRLSDTEIMQRMRYLYGDTLRFSDTYIGRGHRYKFECFVHGTITAWMNNILRGKGCPQCAADARTGTTQAFIESAQNIHGTQYEYKLTEYENARTKVQIECKLHGIFKQTPNKHLSGQGCPICARNVSKSELVLKEYLESLGVVVIHRDRTILAPKELDLWLPEHNIGIEYHGLHWHTVNRVGNAHREKWELANSVGVRIIQIFEDEWLNKQEIVKARLRAIVGKSNKIYARKTEVKTIEFSQAREFLEAHHIQGAGPAAKAYGLFHQDQLVAVATFGKSRTGGMTAAKDSKWEVLRYASEGTVVGGFTKLFSAFLRQYTPEEVISYCDLRYGIGGVYKAAGFQLHGITEPDYWWVPNGKVQRVPRYRTQKHKLRTHPELGAYYAPEKSEVEICAEAGWQKIMGVGNQKWVYNTSN